MGNRRGEAEGGCWWVDLQVPLRNVSCPVGEMPLKLRASTRLLASLRLSVA